MVPSCRELNSDDFPFFRNLSSSSRTRDSFFGSLNKKSSSSSSRLIKPNENCWQPPAQCPLVDKEQKANTKRQKHKYKVKYKDKDNVKYTNTLWPIIIFNVVKSDNRIIFKFLGWLVFWIFSEEMMSRGNACNFWTKKARRLALVPKFAHRGGLQVTANEFYSKKIINILKSRLKLKNRLFQNHLLPQGWMENINFPVPLSRKRCTGRLNSRVREVLGIRFHLICQSLGKMCNVAHFSIRLRKVLFTEVLLHRQYRSETRFYLLVTKTFAGFSRDFI